MKDPKLQTLLAEASKLTMAIGRRTQSPKNDPEDLECLAHALGDIKGTLEIIRDLEIKRHRAEELSSH